MLDRPRHHHYQFAHRVLPRAAFEFGDGLVAAARTGQLNLVDAWNEVGQQLPEPERIPALGLTTAYHRIGSYDVALVTFPPPDAPTEAHFAAIAVPGDSADRTRYIVLEDAFFDGRRYTVIGEWTTEGKHLNGGPGPDPLPDAFLALVTQSLA